MYIGIDFALTQTKALPIAILQKNEGVLNLVSAQNPPEGPGLKVLWDTEAKEKYFLKLEHWFQKIQNEYNQPILQIALDCPTMFCPKNKTIRSSEQEILQKGIKIFKTPTQENLEIKIEEIRQKLNAGTIKKVSGFTLWMYFAVEFANFIQQFAPVREVFPHWFWQNRLGIDYKKSPIQISQKFEILESEFNLSRNEINSKTTGLEADKLDATYCALVASKKEDKLQTAGEAKDLIYALI